MANAVLANGGAVGATHLQSVLLGPPSPRMDVVAADEKARWACGRGDLLLGHDVANQLAEYGDRYISEIHPSNPLAGKEGRVSANHPNNPKAAKVLGPCSVDCAVLRRIMAQSGETTEYDLDRRSGILAV